MKKYAIKLTDQKMKTYQDFQWKLHTKVVTDGKNGLCSTGYTHYYAHPLLAILHNPIHADIKNPRVWKAKVSGKFINDFGMKIGYTEGTLVKELPVPKITNNQRIAYAIYVSLRFYKNKSYVKWAKNWLSGVDRTRLTARSAAESAARSAAESAARSTAKSAAWSAESAAWSTAKSAAWSAAKFEKFLIKCAKKAMKIK